MDDSLTLYKLIILFMLDRVDFPLSTNQIFEFILEKEYTNYFSIQQALHELTESSLVCTESIRSTTSYRLSPEGKDTLSYFGDRIPQAIVDDIIAYFNEKNYQLKNQISVTADYQRTPSQEYTVRCQVQEGDCTVIGLTLTVPDEKTAGIICDNWKTKNSSIYAYLMEELL